MRTRVYQFGLQPPVEGLEECRRQLRLAHEYRCDLVQIERGRRSAIRVCDDTPEVKAAVDHLKEVMKDRPARKEAYKALTAARKAAREAAKEALERIGELDREICKAAYNYYGARGLAWGTRLVISASHEQARKSPLYADDGSTPNDPKFPRYRGTGQAVVQLQGGVTVADIKHDTRVRLQDGQLWLRTGSEGRNPVWAKWPIKMHRQIPADAVLKWARVSLRRAGPWEKWTAEITIELPGPHPRTLDTELQGAIAVEVCWDKPGDNVVVARWRDTRGSAGAVELPSPIVTKFHRANGIRSIRDRLLQGDKEARLPGLRDKLQRALREDHDPKPAWLTEAMNTMHLWSSAGRFFALVKRWRAEKCDAARAAYEMLQEWELRDVHLYEYETGERHRALARRKDWYRKLAASWAQQYKHIVLDDRRLDMEARWGDTKDLQHTVAPYELRTCLAQAFGDDVSKHPVAKDVEAQERSWCEQALDAWIAESARNAGNTNKVEGKRSNAWKERKAKKAAKQQVEATARKAADNPAE